MTTAKLAHYHASVQQILEIAEHATQEKYKIGDVDIAHASFVTQPRFYSPEGDLESPGAEGWLHTQPGSVRVTLLVQVVEVDKGEVMVTVTPQTYQYIEGSPQPRELKPDDPYLPPFVQGRADTLALDIFERAQPYVLPPAGRSAP